MTTGTSRLSELFTTLDGVVLQKEKWTGSGAETFRAVFTEAVCPAVASLTSELSARSALLTSEADQQDAASAHAGNSAHDSDLLSRIGAPHGMGSGFHGTGLNAFTTLGFWEHRGDERSARRGAGRENTPRNDGDGTYDPDADNPNSQYPTPGPAPTARGENGAGEGVPGTQPDAPELPAWTPPTDGAGEHSSEFAGPIDHSVQSLAQEGADIKRGDWPNVSEHLDHFLDNQTGTVTAHPPDADHPQWRYEVDAQVEFRDR